MVAYCNCSGQGVVRIKHFAAIMIVLSFALCFTVKAFAAEAIVFSEDLTVNNDGNAVYSVIVSEKSNIAGLSLTVNYDKNKQTLLDAFVGERFSSSVSSVNKKIAGSVIMSSVTTAPITDGGAVLTLVFDGKSISDISFSVSECIDKDMHSLDYTIKNIEPDTPKPNETTKNSNQGGDSSKSDVQNGSKNNDRKPTDNNKEYTDNSRNQDQNAPTTSLDAGTDATNPDGSFKNKEDSINPSDQSKTEVSMPGSQQPTSDAATADESNQSNNYIILITVFIALCAVAITIIYFIKRRKKHEK